MKQIPRCAPLSFEDFCIMVREDQKADLIDGVIYMASPEHIEENRLMTWLFCILSGFIEERALGEVYCSRVAFRLGETQGPEPDIAFVRKDRLHLFRPCYMDGPPDLAVEIVSPDSVHRDYIQKLAQYRRAGVAEYWIIDPIRRKVTHYRLTARRRYGIVPPQKGVLHSKVLPGFWLRPRWLWHDPRPRRTALLAQMLQE